MRPTDLIATGSTCPAPSPGSPHSSPAGDVVGHKPVIRRLQNEWSDRRRRLTWESPQGPITMAGWAIRPLTTGQAMIDEGRRMRHCVADYIEDCHQSRYRVFTAEHPETGEPAATFGLRLVEGQWQLEQVRGRRNHAVEEGLERVAQEVEGRYRSAVQAT